MNIICLLVLGLAVPVLALSPAEMPNVEYETTDAKVDPTITQLSKFYSETDPLNDQIFPGFGIQKPMSKFSPKLLILDPEAYNKRAGASSANFYINTCSCPYLKKYDLNTFHSKDSLTDDEQYASLVTYLIYFVRRSLADLESQKSLFFLGDLKLASVQESDQFGAVTPDQKLQDEHDFGLSLSFRFKSEFGAFATGAGQIVQMSIHARKLAVVDDDGDGIKFDLTAKFQVSNKNGPKGGEESSKTEAPELREVVFVEGFRVKHNFLSNACALSRLLASHAIKAALARTSPNFRSVNFCSHIDFVAEVIAKVGDGKDPQAINGAYDFGLALKGAGSDTLDHSEGYWTLIKEQPKPDWVPHTYTHAVAFPNQELQDFQIETAPITGSEPHQPKIRTQLELLNEAHYSEHRQRFSVLKAKNERKGSPEIDFVKSVLGVPSSEKICQKFRLLLTLSICPFSNDKLCQDLAYLRTINNLRFDCEEGSQCDSEADSQFQIWMIFQDLRIGWAKFGVFGGDKSHLCYELETNYLTETQSKMNCWNDVNDWESNASYFAAFLIHFTDMARSLEQKLLSGVTKLEVMEFVLMLFEDYEASRTRYQTDQPHPKIRDQLSDLWKNHKLRTDLQFQVSGSAISVRTHLASHPEVFFEIQVLDKQPEFIKLILTNPSKREEVFINKDIGAKFGIPLYHAGGQSAKEEKFGQLFAHFGLQIYNFVNSILPPVPGKGTETPKPFPTQYESCYRYLEANFQSDNLQLSTFMAFVQLALEKFGFRRVLNIDPSQVPLEFKVLNEDSACDPDNKFGVIKPNFKFPDRYGSSGSGLLIDPFPEEIDPLAQWLFYATQEDAQADAANLDFEPTFDETTEFPAPTVTTRDVLAYSIEKEFNQRTVTVQMLFGSPELRRQMVVIAYFRNSGITKSVLLQIDCGYFIQESVIYLSVFSETRDQVYSSIKQVIEKMKMLAGISKNVGKRQGYTVDIVKQIVESIIATQSSRHFCVTKTAAAYTFTIIPETKQPERSVDRNLRLFTRSSLDERRLGTVIDDCGDNIVMPNIHIKYASEAKKEIVISFIRNEKRVTESGVDLPFSDSYTIQSVYPFEHKKVLTQHLTEWIKKLE